MNIDLDVLQQAGKQKEILKHLKIKIEATGPISVAEYMKTALTFPLMVSKLWYLMFS